MNREQLTQQNRRLVKKLLLIIGGMFCFGFALVPLYDVFCEFTGLNGRNTIKAEQQSQSIDSSRVVRLQLTTSVSPGMPWQFNPNQHYIDVHPGENKVVKFSAKNLSGQAIVGQAIPSVSPGLAGLYLNKTECFCFNQQPLAGGESVEMGLVFFISPDIPEHISTLTLSYTLFNVTDVTEAESHNLQAAL